MRIFRIVGLVTAVLVVAGGGTYLLVGRPSFVPAPTLTVASTAERIARGRYLYNLANCDGCHSPRDWTRFGGPVIDGRRGEGVEFPKEPGVPGRVVAGNITPD